MAGAEWFYGKDNTQHGPISAAELKQLAQDGRLKPADLVWREGMGEWIAASKVKGLFDDSPAAPPQARPAAPKASPAPAVPPPAAEPQAARRPQAADVFAQPYAPDAPAERRPSVHVLNSILEYVRGQFPERFVEATSRLFTLAGHYGLYAAMVLVLGFGLLAGVKLSQLNAVLGAVAWAFALAVLQYAAGRFFKALDELNRSTSGVLGSSTVPDCFALLAMIFGLMALIGLAVKAVQAGLFVLLLPAIVIFILCQYLAVVAVNHGSLNITIDPDARAGEEALGVFSFAIKVWLRLVPVAFGVGIACGVLMLLAAGGLLFLAPGADAAAQAANESPAAFSSFDREAPDAPAELAALPAMALAFSAEGLLAGSAALPLAAYILFIFAHLSIDIIRAVLAVPGKLDALAEADRK
jgi:hypothetical protein